MKEINVDRMLMKLSSKQLIEWQTMFSLEPWGTENDWGQAAMIAAVIANSVPKKRGAKKFSPKDFMPKFGEQLKTPEEKSKGLLGKFMGVVNMFKQAEEERRAYLEDGITIKEPKQ